MESLLETIRAALTEATTDEARAAGVTACRTILAVLEAKPGEPLGAPTDTNAPAPQAIGAPQIAEIVGALRGMPPEQLLDLAITRLRAALPAGAAVPRVAPVRFQLLPIAPLAATVGLKGGGS